MAAEFEHRLRFVTMQLDYEVKELRRYCMRGFKRAETREKRLEWLEIMQLRLKGIEEFRQELLDLLRPTAEEE